MCGCIVCFDARAMHSHSHIYNMDLTTLDWRQYNMNYCFGLMRYVLKEDLVEVTQYEHTFGLNDGVLPHPSNTYASNNTASLYLTHGRTI